MIAAVIITTTILNHPTRNEESIFFNSTYKDEQVKLQASYMEVKNSEYAALICPGYSCDRQKWRPMADLLCANGITVMSFDYAGQGASSDTIGFDNAKTDAIPIEIADAIEVLHTLSGVPYEKIILVGHSMGGRSILRLMYDVNDPESYSRAEVKTLPGNVILMSPEVNYIANAQASLFAGTTDAEEDPWKDYNESYTKGVNVYLFGSTADDIVREEDIYEIYRRLGGKNVPTEGVWSSTQTNSLGQTIQVKTTKGVLHSYQMYSPEFAVFVNDALSSITGKPSVYGAGKMLLVYFGWIGGLLGLLFVMIGLNKKKNVSDSDFNLSVVLTSESKFLWFKLFMWLPGLLAAFIVCCVCVAMPFGSPVMNIPYMCCIAGYGILMSYLYKKGKVKGVSGSLPKMSLKLPKGSVRSENVIIVLFLLFFVWYVLRSSMYRLIPFNARLFWVVFATVLMTIGYYVSGCESDFLKSNGASRRTIILYNIIQYVALFLLIAFYLVIRSYSGVIGQAQNMVFMYIFCVPLGDYVRRTTRSRMAGAVMSACVFQTFMITSAALISFL